MSSDGNKPIDIPSDQNKDGRIRTTSGDSTTSEDGSSNSTGKRQRTTSQTFMIAGGMTAASPPKFVSLEEIMQAANGMKDMALVHHIAVDKDFKLKRVEPEDKIQKIVKETMHKAFWDLLRQELAEDPPKYIQALQLLSEIREGLTSLLLPQHTKLKQHIIEVLDIDLIKQQAENGVLDFHHYAQYVISIMAKLCAPVRDEKIKELTQTTDVIDTFKSILETLDLMALDMANFTIELAKPDIIAHSVEYERKKFADILAVQQDGLQATRKWLLKHLDTSGTIPSQEEDYNVYIRSITKRAFTEACVDLLEWDNKEPFPETFMLDEERLKFLSVKTNRVIFIGTVLLVTASNAGSDLQSLTSFKENLKKNVSVIFDSTKCEEDLEGVLPNVAEQVIKDIQDSKKAHELGSFSDEAANILRQQILEMHKPDHRIKHLVRQRVKEFLLQIIESSTAAPQKVPSGLTALQKELTAIAGQFLRVVSHNSTVFCIYYFDLVSAALPKPA